MTGQSVLPKGNPLGSFRKFVGQKRREGQAGASRPRSHESVRALAREGVSVNPTTCYLSSSLGARKHFEKGHFGKEGIPTSPRQRMVVAAGVQSHPPILVAAILMRTAPP